MSQSGNSLAVQWLGLCIFTAEHPGSILGRGTKILQVLRCSQGKKKTESTSLPKPLHDAVTGMPPKTEVMSHSRGSSGLPAGPDHLPGVCCACGHRGLSDLLSKTLGLSTPNPC